MNNKLPTKLYTSDLAIGSKQTQVQTQPTIEEILHKAELALNDRGGYSISLSILVEAIQANVGDSMLVSQLVTARAKVYIIMKEFEYALDEVNYILELQPDNIDAENAKMILTDRIAYHKKVKYSKLYS